MALAVTDVERAYLDSSSNPPAASTPLVDWCMAKDVPRALIRTGDDAEYLDESRGIFVSRPPSLPSRPNQDHRTTER